MSKRNVGRPIAEKPKNYNLVVRLDEITLSKLDEECKKKNLTRSELVRLLIEKI